MTLHLLVVDLASVMQLGSTPLLTTPAPPDGSWTALRVVSWRSSLSATPLAVCAAIAQVRSAVGARLDGPGQPVPAALAPRHPPPPRGERRPPREAVLAAVRCLDEDIAKRRDGQPQFAAQRHPLRRQFDHA